MGLAAPRKRRKLALDPNNTTWANDGDTYGQRILAAQGWSPGTFLGARDAAHAEHYSSGSASHVRVVLKDDNLGLGASKSLEAEATGLGNFQDLLGRLNGKESAEIEKDQRARVTLGKKLYAQHRWGATKFVRAGFLVGDRVEEALADSTTPQDEDLSQDKPKSASKHKRKHLEATSSARTSEDKAEKSTERAAKQQRRQERKQRKEERAQQKEDRREARRQAKRKAKSEAKDQAKRGPQVSDPSGNAEPDTKAGAAELAQQSIASAPTAKHFNVRQRYLQQKRKAAMDPQALREILMVKS